MSDNHTPMLANVTEAKAFARTLRREQAAAGIPITYARALEITAHRMGYKDWNTLCGKLGPRPTFSPQLGDRLRGFYLKQAFTGHVHAVSSMNHGRHFNLTIQFDEPVDVVTFESFSSFRRRVAVTVDDRGQSPLRTSDGEPHLIVAETLSDVV